MSNLFGVVLKLNGKEIALEPKTAFSDLKKNGIEAELPPGTEVHLGSIVDGLEGLMKSIDPKFVLPDVGDLPDLQVLKDAFGTLKTAELTINDLYIKIPPKDVLTNLSYRLGVYVGWPEAKTLIGGLEITGFSVKIEKKPGEEVKINP